jgi:hypothetical protein
VHLCSPPSFWSEATAITLSPTIPRVHHHQPPGMRSIFLFLSIMDHALGVAPCEDFRWNGDDDELAGSDCLHSTENYLQLCVAGSTIFHIFMCLFRSDLSVGVSRFNWLSDSELWCVVILT